MKPSRDISRLIEIMAALRTPGTGCPWDLEQNFATIAPYTLEEAYEVADAIARGDLADLRDELGDLLLQVVFHARMAQEQGAFAFGDVVEAITAKLIRRGLKLSHLRLLAQIAETGQLSLDAARLSIIATTSTSSLSSACASACAGGLKRNAAGGPPQLRVPAGG